MDFFQAQDAARRRSKILVFLYVLAVVGIIWGIYAPLQFLLRVAIPGAITDLELVTIVTAGVLFFVGIGSVYRTLQLQSGGAAVATLLGGRPVPPATTDPDERRLVNVVEEMAIAAGLPVPAIFLLDKEPGINAFAAGHTIHNAAIGITRGALERLNRDELQGVVAHEFSHILNGDMRLNTRIMGLLYGIFILAAIGRGLIESSFSRRGRQRSSAAGLYASMVGLVLFVAGYIGVFFGRLIQAAVSRQREYLADAAAVQFTRNPAGIVSALKVIGAHLGSTRLENQHAEEVSHFLFADRTRSFIGRLFATHPPQVKRIRRIDPTFDGDFTKIPLQPQARADAIRALEAERADRAARQAPLDPIGILGPVGAPTASHLDQARAVIDAIPESLQAAAHSTDDAPALVFALLYASGGEKGESAAAAIRDLGGETLLERTRSLAREIQASRTGRFALLELVLPTLRGLPPEETETLLRAVDTIIKDDGKVDAFEELLSQHLALRLGPRTKRPRPGTVHSLVPLRHPVNTVLSALAYSGAKDDCAARAALEAATRGLPLEFGKPTLRSRERATPEAFREALDQLRAGSPGVRRRLLFSAAQVVSADGVIHPREAELLQTLAAALDCPVPLPLGARQMAGGSRAVAVATPTPDSARSPNGAPAPEAYPAPGRRA